MTVFWELMRAFWTTIRMGICVRILSTKELKRKEFIINIHNINQEIGIQVTIVLGIKPQKYIFFSKLWPPFWPLMCLFWTLVRMGICTCIPQSKNWKRCSANSQDMNQAIGMPVTIVLEIKLQKSIFWQIMSGFLTANVPLLNPFKDENLHTYATT